MVNVRIATPFDANKLLEIYAPYILTTAFTFETEVPTVQEFEARLRSYLHKYPWIVCEINGAIAGYVYASVHRQREAYQWTCECSVYLHENFKGKGIGKELYDVLFRILKMQGLVNVYAGITLPNYASVRLHEKCSFVQFAIYDNIGYKLNSWHKVGWWKLQLNELVPKPSPPVKFSEMHFQLFASLLEQTANHIDLKTTG